MTWRGPRTTRDPLLTTTQWRTIRKHWQRLRLPCARCGRAIDYDGPRHLPNGRLNLHSLVVGHKVSRYTAKQLGWTEQQINHITNTQPECVQCSNVSGARLGQRVQATRQQQQRSGLDDSRRW